MTHRATRAAQIPLAPEAPLRDVSIWDAAVEVERRDDVTYVTSPLPLPDYPDRITDRLVKWAGTAPDRIYITEATADESRRGYTYAETLDLVRRIGSALLQRNLSPERPIMILSGNDIEHALLTLAGMYIGVPVSPISTAYSLIATDYEKVAHIYNVLTPGLVFASDGVRFEKAIRAVIPDDIELVVTRRPIEGRGGALFSDLAAHPIDPAVDAAHAKVGPDTIAKFLFTSGSTGAPKAVINTQRMLCVNQVQLASALKFLGDEPPVILDWLPWNHTFGGNHNMGIALYHGGTFHIDAGKPVPGGIEPTVKALRDISPTIYFNVPKGYEALLPYLRAEPELAKKFFGGLKILFFAGASLSQHIWDELDAIALETLGEIVMMMSSLGSTETAPAALMVTRETLRAGAVGIPLPGVDVKLVPNQGKLEARLKGPSMTPGYWRAPDLTAKAFDEEGYYLLGDALKFVDETRPHLGFIFDGRVSEDFKLATGTWVSVGPMRAKVILAFAPFVKDAVIAGHDRDDVGVLIIPEELEVRALTPDFPPTASFGDVLADARVIAAFQRHLDLIASNATGSSTRVVRLAVLATPPSIDANEITDKGSINQRAVLTRRAELVDDMYSKTPSARILLASKAS
jgi:feruloyl-CoA synthase